jgi:hypothetical protein
MLRLIQLGAAMVADRQVTDDQAAEWEQLVDGLERLKVIGVEVEADVEELSEAAGEFPGAQRKEGP